MKIRKATPKDVPAIWKLTREHAKLEKFLDVCTITEAETKKMLFAKDAIVECFVIEDKGKVVGMGKLMTTMETFTGIPFFLLRDFMLTQSHRNKGYGKKFMEFAMRLADTRRYLSVQWNVLDWNKPTLAFYKKIGAQTIETTRMNMRAKRGREIDQLEIKAKRKRS